MRQRPDFGFFWFISDVRKTGQVVNSINVHRARAANALSARTSESQSRVNFVLNVLKWYIHVVIFLVSRENSSFSYLDFDKSIQNHGATGVEVNLVIFHSGCSTLVGVPSVDFESLGTFVLLFWRSWKFSYLKYWIKLYHAESLMFL